VVPFEIGVAPPEALRAQTIAARSEAVAALRNRMYAGDGYDICGDVDCQVYGGTMKSTAEIDNAIRTTSGLILQAGGLPLNAYFASNCGGHSESVENVWPQRSGPRHYWSAHPDADSLVTESLRNEQVLRGWLANGPATFCNPITNPGLPDWGRKYWRWKMRTSPDSLALGTPHGSRAGRIVRIDSVRRGSSGRILSAVFVGERGSFRVSSELEFRQVWSPPLRSSCVVVDREGPAERPDRFLLTGAGWGHGVGMCQSGAVGMALAGRTAEQILSHYYPTANVAPAY
jgi:SpoIID/LytB domain protein